MSILDIPYEVFQDHVLCVLSARDIQAIRWTCKSLHSMISYDEVVKSFRHHVYDRIPITSFLWKLLIKYKDIHPTL